MSEPIGVASNILPVDQHIQFSDPIGVASEPVGGTIIVPIQLDEPISGKVIDPVGGDWLQ